MAESPQASTRERKLQNTLKRLWWCCFICDRVMSLTLRRNVKIANFNAMDSHVLGGNDLADEIHNSDVYDSSSKLFLAGILEKLVELCVILTDVLAITSSVRESCTLSSATEAAACRTGLQRWYSAFLEIKRATNGNDTADNDGANSSNSMVLFANLVAMYYQ